MHNGRYIPQRQGAGGGRKFASVMGRIYCTVRSDKVAPEMRAALHRARVRLALESKVTLPDEGEACIRRSSASVFGFTKSAASRSRSRRTLRCLFPQTSWALGKACPAPEFVRSTGAYRYLMEIRIPCGVEDGTSRILVRCWSGLGAGSHRRPLSILAFSI